MPRGRLRDSVDDRQSAKATNAQKAKGNGANLGFETDGRMDPLVTAPRVLAVLDGLEGELVELACGLVNVPSPPGHEKAAAEFLAAWLDARGIPSYVQEVEATRGNAVGRALRQRKRRKRHFQWPS
jgi:hypothetical protein